MFNSIVSFELISHLLVFAPVNVNWVPFIDFVIMFAQVVQFFNQRNPSLTSIPAGIYLLKVKNRNSRTRCEIYLKLQRHQNDANDVVLLSLLLTEDAFAGWDSISFLQSVSHSNPRQQPLVQTQYCKNYLQVIKITSRWLRKCNQQSLNTKMVGSLVVSSQSKFENSCDFLNGILLQNE